MSSFLRHSPPFSKRISLLPLGVSVVALTSALNLTAAAAAETAEAPSTGQQAEVPNAPPTPPSAAPKAAEPGQIDEVVVTARRRAEKAQDVPIAMTVLSGDHLADNGTDKLTQLQFLAPSFGISLINPRNATLTVRGIGNNPANDGLSGSVGIYLDGVYLDRQGMAHSNLQDIDRIELLRGPQGTLFGKNTTAGALNITTNKPTFTPEGSAELSLGSYETFGIKGTVSGPIVDNVLAARLSVFNDSHSGYIESPNGGPYDDLGRRGVKGQLLFQPNEDISVRLISDYSSEDDHSGFQLLYSQGSSKASIPFSQWSASPTVRAIINPTDPFNTNANQPQIVKTTNWGNSILADWALPGGYTLTSVSAIRYFEFLPHNNSGLTVNALGANGPLYSSNANDRDLQASQEVRLASPTGGPIDYVTGLYYFWKRLAGDQQNFYANNYSALTGTKNAPLNNAMLKYDSAIEARSMAAFGQANWHLTDRLTLTGGLRETYEADKENFLRYGLTGGAGSPPSNTIPYSGSGSIGNWSFGALGSLAYKVTDDVLGYGTLSHGTKAGGFVGASTPTQTGTSFAPFSTLILHPETANEAELGIKSALLNRRLIVNADAFVTRVSNYQVAATITTPNGIAASGVNAKAVLSKGLEIEATARPIDGLSITASSSFDLSSYQSFRAAPPVQGATLAYQDLTGRPVNGVPRWTGGLSGTYSKALAADVIGSFSAEYAYKSSQFGYIDDSSYSRIKAYGLANFRLNINYDSNYDAALWVRNAFNTGNFDVVGPLSSGLGGYYASVGEPRVFGATVRVKF